MAANKEADEARETQFKKDLDDGKYTWSGGIIYSHFSEQFEFMPAEGYGHGSLVALAGVDFYEPTITPAQRMKKFKLVTELDEIGSDAQFFARVEMGTEDEMVTWIRSILNKQLEGKTADEKVKKYQSMTGLYRDTLLKDWLYMTRSVSNPKYTWIPRVKYGVQIKYESDIITNAPHNRIAPRGPQSVASSAPSEFSIGSPLSLGARLLRASGMMSAGAAATASTSKAKASDLISKAAEKEAEPSKKAETASGSAVQPEVADKPNPQTEATEQQHEEPEEADITQDDEIDEAALDSPSLAEIAVTEEEIQAELLNVKVYNPLGPKLKTLYDELPDAVEDIPSPNSRPDAFKDFVVNLRPFETAYRREAGKDPLTRIYKSKNMSKKTQESEYERLKALVKEKIEHEEAMEQKRRDQARLRVAARKRAAARKDEADKAADKADSDDAISEGAKTDSVVNVEIEAASDQQSIHAAADTQEPEAGPSGGAEPETQAKSSSDESEHYTPSKTASRSKPAPPPVRLPITPRTPRAPDSLEGISSRIGALVTNYGNLDKTCKSLRDDLVRIEGKYDNKLGKIGDGMQGMAEACNKMSNFLTKQDLNNQMHVAGAEREITKHLPLGKIDEAAKLILSNSVAQQVVAQHVIRRMEASKKADNTANLAILAAETIFSNVLRAFLYVDRGGRRSDADVRKGWDKQEVPPEFYDLFETYIYKVFAVRLTPASPSTRKRVWMDVLVEHFGNTREEYFKWVGKDDLYLDSMIESRYQARLEHFYEHKDPDDPTQPASLEQEKVWYAEKSNQIGRQGSVEDLKTALNLRKRANFPNKTGVPPTVDGVLAAINKLSSLHYGIPGFAVAALSLEPGQVPDPVEVSGVLKDLLMQAQGYEDFDEMGFPEDGSEPDDADATRKETPAPTTSKAAASKKTKQTRRDQDDDDDEGAGKESPKKRARRNLNK